MDADRFEALQRSLADSSRRHFLAILATVVSACLVGGDGQTALAKGVRESQGTPPQTPPPSGCTRNSQCTTTAPCRSGRCDPTDPARDANGCVFDRVTGGSISCGTGACERTVQECVNGEPQICVPGTPDCTGKQCGDADGCGGFCTTQQGCSTNQTCINGACVATGCNPPCTGGRYCCDAFGNGILSCTQCCGDGHCVADTLANSQGRSVCWFGNCTCPAEEPLLCRVFGSTQRHCTDPLSDKTNCSAIPGDCGFACAPPDDDDWDCCGGICAFVRGCVGGSRMSDCQRQHCGQCGSANLAEGVACCEGSCVPENDENCGYCGNDCTEAGLTCCASACVDPDSDEFNCGECQNVCESGEACCDGECTRLGTEENCGSCDGECEENEQCIRATCV